MPGEVIRDVILRVSVQQGTDTRAFDQASKSAAQATGAANVTNQAINTVFNNYVNLAQQQTKTQSAVQRELEKTKLQIREVAESYAFAGQKGGAELDELIAKHKMLQGAIAQSDRIIREAQGGPGPKPAPGLGARAWGAAAAVGEYAGPGAAAVAVIAMAPQVTESLAKSFRALSIDAFGSNEQALKEGYISPSAAKAADSVIDALARASRSGGIAGRLADLGGSAYLSVSGLRSGNAMTPGQFGQMSSVVGVTEGFTKALAEQSAAMKKEVELRQRNIQLTEEANARQKSALQKELTLIEERVRTAQSAYDAEKKTQERAQEQFGLANADEKKDFLRIAEKIAGAGGSTSTLSKDELKFARGNSAFAELIAEEARKGADQTGWKEIARLLGADKRLADKAAEVAVAVKQELDVKLKLEGLENMTEPDRKALEEIFKRFAEQQQAIAKAEIERIARQILRNQPGRN